MSDSGNDYPDNRDDDMDQQPAGVGDQPAATARDIPIAAAPPEA